MNGSEKCRLCTRLLVEHTLLQNLFDCNNSKILQNVEEITGVKLKKIKSLPEYYCNFCENDLEQACQFRNRVLKAQKFFHNSTYKDLNNVEFIELEPVLTNEMESQMIIEETSEDTDQLVEDIIKEESHLNAEDYEEVIEENEYVNENDVQYMELKPVGVMNDFASEPVDEQTEVDAEFISNEIEEYDVDYENEIDHTETETSKISKTKRKKERSTPVKFICDQCGNYFTCRHHFLTHLRRHAGDKQFQCEICSDKFFTNSELSRHMRRHTGERPFSCRYCERTFTDYSTRIKHERTHTNERPFSCNRCDKSFTTSYILKNHMLTHTGERSFQCNLCNKAFQRQTHLVVHYRSIIHQQNEMKHMSMENVKQTTTIVPTSIITPTEMHISEQLS